MLVLLLMILSFVFGAVTVLAVEAAGVVVLILWMNRKIEKEQVKANEAEEEASSLVPHLDPSFYNKQGFLWVLEPEKVPKGQPLEKAPREQKPKKDIVEVTPVRKHAKMKDRCLVLTEPDGSLTNISLRGCIIEAVSASGLPSRKWAKRYPIKLENKVSKIYKGSTIFYVYLETSWEKESWCKALRLASDDDKEKVKWFAILKMEFHNYLTSLNAEYPSFMKPSLGINADPLDKSIKMDGSSSKVRQFLKRLKKAAKSGPEIKSSSTSMPSHDERNLVDKSYSFDDPVLSTRSVNPVPKAKPMNLSADDSMLTPSSLTSSTSGRSQVSSTSGRDPDDRIFADEGSLCWNLLISRLFFDAKSNVQMKTALQSRLQRTLSSMRTPSYIGEITCTSVDLGNLPPYIHGMRILPSDMSEVWGMEIDIEYAGGAVLDIETRLEVRELDSQEGEETNLESSSVGEVTSDLLEGIEHYGKQLNSSEDTVNWIDQKDEIDHKLDDSKNCKITTRLSSQVSRWKSILQSAAKQVSQVPISLGIKVTSLRGTLRLYIKSPPSDQIWFGFTSMPHIDFDLESSVGDHKITSGHLALFLISRFKAAIRETLVLPNCESAYVPWMLAEVNDWVPRNVAPFMWINQDSAANTMTKEEAHGSQPGKVSSMVDIKESPVARVVDSKEAPVVDSKEASNASQEDKHDKSNNVGCSTHPTSESLDLHGSPAPTTHSISKDDSLQDLGTPLLKNDEPREISGRIPEERNEYTVRSRSLNLIGEQSPTREDDDPRFLKRAGTRARMLSLRKKMGEKLEEKRRHLEEKGRNIVEKMRDNRN